MDQSEWMRTFGDNLRDLLEDYKMTQEELAKSVGVNRSTISRYICGDRMPNVRMILKISYALDCDLGDLIDFGEAID